MDRRVAVRQAPKQKLALDIWRFPGKNAIRALHEHRHAIPGRAAGRAKSGQRRYPLPFGSAMLYGECAIGVMLWAERAEKSCALVLHRERLT